jgi:Uma2 family endonuclease
MTFDDYLVWEARQEAKYELVDGQPVLRRVLRGMSGGTKAHCAIAGRLVGAINARLPRGGPCVAMGSDFKVRSPTGNARYPDVIVDCSSSGWKDLYTPAPTVLIEVLSPSNDDKDLDTRRTDYMAIPSAAIVAFVGQDAPSAETWTRDGVGWRRALAEGKHGALDLAVLDMTIPFTEIYAHILFAGE